MKEYTPEQITQLAANEIFTFGSNSAGIHGAGAARLALNRFGAVWGVGEGLQGSAYGIPTKDHNIQVLPLEAIATHIYTFLVFAARHTEKKFYVTAIGTGLAGYSAAQIGPLFMRHEIPANVVLPREFWPD